MLKTKQKGKSTDISKQMDDLLGRPPVPNSSTSKVTFNKQEDELLNLRVKLQQKEKALAEHEKTLVHQSRELEKHVVDLRKARAQLWNELDKLKTTKETLSAEVVVLHQEIKDRKKQIHNAEQIHEVLAKKESTFRVKEHELERREHLVFKKEKELDVLNRHIKEKEQMLDRLTKLINTEKDAFEKKKVMLLREIDDLDKKKILSNAQLIELRQQVTMEHEHLEQALRDARELYKAAEKKNEAIDKRAFTTQKELDDKRKMYFTELNKKHSELDKREEELTKLSLSLDKRELELKELTDELQKEKEQMTSEKDEEISVRRNIIELTTEERIIEKRLADKQSQLTALGGDFQSKTEELKHDRQMLDEKEDEIIQKIKQLEDDQRTLAKKEDEFIEKIHELEKDKKLFDTTVAEFSNKLDIIEGFEQEVTAVQRRESEIEMKEQKIARNVDYKANIAALKREKEALQEQLKELQKKIGKASEADKKMMLKEKKLQEREHMLNEKERRIKELFEEVSSEREAVAQEGYMTFVGKDVTTSDVMNREEEIKTTVELVDEKNPKNYTVVSLLQDARHALTVHRVDDAKQIYSKLNKLYTKLPQTKEKKRLYYEILELKTDIELTAF
jgi:chromosome segregation ATPase